MAEKTIVDKASQAVGFGMAMAEDAAGAVKTAVGAAVATITDALKKAPGTKAPVKQLSKPPTAKRASKKAPGSAPGRKPASTNADKDSTAKKAVRTVAAKKTTTKKAVKKTARRQK
jgi:hypothetical protein